MIWALWYLFKYMKSYYLLWWFIFILFFRYFHLSVIDTRTKYTFSIWNNVRGWSCVSTVNRPGSMDCSFILMIIIWIYFINLIISYCHISWPDLLECDISVTDLNLHIFIDLRSFNSDCTIDTEIYISQLYITLWWLLTFSPEEAYISLLLSVNIQLFHHLIHIFLHDALPILTLHRPTTRQWSMKS